MSKYKLILFDMDGTIANSDPMIIETFHRLYKRFTPKRVCNDHELLYFSGPPMIKTLENEFPGYSLKELYDSWVEFSTQCTKEGYITPFTYVKEAITNIIKSGKITGVVTNKKTTMANDVLRLLNLKDVMLFCIGSDDVKEGKPSPEGISLAMQKAGIKDKSQVLYVGDNSIDYYTARNAGVDSMLLTWGPREFKKDTQPTYWAKDFQEVEAIING